MTWMLLIGALGLVFVCEGLLPFFNPGLWRRVFEKAVTMTDGQIRFLGLSCMLLGVAILFIFLG